MPCLLYATLNTTTRTYDQLEARKKSCDLCLLRTQREERERGRGKDRNMGLVTVDYSANIFLLNKGKGGRLS